MNGMRTKGMELSTEGLQGCVASKEELPLSRINKQADTSIKLKPVIATKKVAMSMDNIYVGRDSENEEYTVTDVDKNLMYTVSTDPENPKGELMTEFDKELEPSSKDLWLETLSEDSLPFDTLPEYVQEYINSDPYKDNIVEASTASGEDIPFGTKVEFYDITFGQTEQGTVIGMPVENTGMIYVVKVDGGRQVSGLTKDDLTVLETEELESRILSNKTGSINYIGDKSEIFRLPLSGWKTFKIYKDGADIPIGQGVQKITTGDIEYTLQKLLNKFPDNTLDVSDGFIDIVPNEDDDTLEESKTASKKQAVYFDGYSYRVTIESLAGDNNQTYSMVTNMLSAADIRYQEVRRYTIEPDRVCLDILITKDDVDVIKGLAKEGKEYNVKFTFNDSVSEGIAPKIIVTPEKEVEEKV